MKKLILLLFCGLVGGLACQSQQTPAPVTLHWFDSWTEASAKSQKEGRVLMVEFSTEWCHYCRFVEEQIFTESQVAEKLEPLVLLRVDGDAAIHQSLLSQYAIEGFPTFVFLDPKGKEILRINDISSPDDALAILDAVATRKVTAQELKKADAFLTANENDKAFRQYKKVYESLPPEDSLREEALYGVVTTFEGKREEGQRWIQTYLTDYPLALFRPDALKKLASYYKTIPLKQMWLTEAARLIEARLDSPWTHSLKWQRVLLDQEIDLLAEIYQELEQFSKVEPLYLKGAALCEEKIKRSGGLLRNQNLIGTVSYYYRRGAQPEKAVAFLKKAKEVFPDYWFVDQALAKALAADKKYNEAIQVGERAYSAAKDVAKSRVAMTLSEVHAKKGDLEAALQTLQRGMDDLRALPGSDKGRAAQMITILQNRLEEYQTSPVF